MPKAQIEMRPADDAEIIAGDLIPRYHVHLIEANILYLFTTQERKKHDRTVLGTAQKLGPLHRYLAKGSVSESFDFLLLFSEQEWAMLDMPGRRALVDHELAHCWADEKVKKDGSSVTTYSIVGHDVEEFTDIVARHGLRSDGLKILSKAIDSYNATRPDNAAPEGESVVLATKYAPKYSFDDEPLFPD